MSDNVAANDKMMHWLSHLEPEDGGLSPFCWDPKE